MFGIVPAHPSSLAALFAYYPDPGALAPLIGPKPILNPIPVNHVVPPVVLPMFCDGQAVGILLFRPSP